MIFYWFSKSLLDFKVTILIILNHKWDFLILYSWNRDLKWKLKSSLNYNLRHRKTKPNQDHSTTIVGIHHFHNQRIVVNNYINLWWFTSFLLYVKLSGFYLKLYELHSSNIKFEFTSEMSNIMMVHKILTVIFLWEKIYRGSKAQLLLVCYWYTYWYLIVKTFLFTIILTNTCSKCNS